jgi:hypothetical protein
MSIFESPDGGKTVYMREPGTNERRLIQAGLYEEWNGFTMQYDWDGLAAKHPAIQEKLEELKVLARLCADKS